MLPRTSRRKHKIKDNRKFRHLQCTTGVQPFQLCKLSGSCLWFQVRNAASTAAGADQTGSGDGAEQVGTALASGRNTQNVDWLPWCMGQSSVSSSTFNNRVLLPAIVLLKTRRFDPETRAFFGYTSKLSQQTHLYFYVALSRCCYASPEIVLKKC